MLKKLKIYYVFVSLPFVMLLIGAVAFFDGIKYTINRNPHPQINYIIFVIILVGGVVIILNSRRLMHEAKTIVDFSKALHAKTDLATLKEKTNRYTGILACITQMVAASGDRAISHQEQAALEHELANVRSRLNRRNALPQYLTGLLVGMGLLGTFIGLLATLNDISILITSFADLDMATVNPIQVFSTMITRMKAPMQSMAIAFSASMFGLLGSIVLGLMMVGLRRLQGDIFSVLSSEVARHIEIALSFESISLKSRVGSTGDLSTDILLRIEERLAESARVRQRALSAEIDDFKKQRGDMLQALTEQTEASNNFRGELQQLGNKLGTILTVMERGNGELAGHISDLTVDLSGNAKETHKLLTMQLDEQKGLRTALDSYNIEERLAEAAKMQQRALSSVIDDFREQRGDMLRTLGEQTEANNNFRNELQKIGGQLGDALNIMGKGSDEIANQISELTVHMAAGTKQSHILLSNTSNNFSSELQKLGSQLTAQLDTLSNISGQGDDKLANQISELTVHLDESANKSLEQIDNANNVLRNELQQLGTQLNNISIVTEKGNSELTNQISGLTVILSELQKLSSQLGSISTITEEGNHGLTKQISELIVQIDASAKESLSQLGSASNNLRNELQQLGSRLDSIANVTESGNNKISSQISELPIHMATATNEPPKLPITADE